MYTAETVVIDERSYRHLIDECRGWPVRAYSRADVMRTMVHELEQHIASLDATRARIEAMLDAVMVPDECQLCSHEDVDVAEFA